MQTLCERPDLSVIVPCYNLERFITPLLDSLKEQDLGDYKVEFIFVDNCCTDRTAQIIKDSGLECRLINCNIQGCGAARNAGMEVASGKFIWFMDGDDYLLSDTAIKQVLDKAIGEDLNILRIPFESDRFTYLYFSMVWQYCFKKSYIDEFRFPNIQPAEDDAFMQMVLKKAKLNELSYLNLPRIDKPLYFYNYLREGSNMYRHHILGERNIKLPQCKL